MAQQLKKNLPASAGGTEDAGLIPGSGRSPEEGNGNPLQYSCLKNPMGRGAWWAPVRKSCKELDRHNFFFIIWSLPRVELHLLLLPTNPTKLHFSGLLGWRSHVCSPSKLCPSQPLHMTVLTPPRLFPCLSPDIAAPGRMREASPCSVALCAYCVTTLCLVVWLVYFLS